MRSAPQKKSTHEEARLVNGFVNQTRLRHPRDAQLGHTETPGTYLLTWANTLDQAKPHEPRLFWEQEAGGSRPPSPTTSSEVVPWPPRTAALRARMRGAAGVTQR